MNYLVKDSLNIRCRWVKTWRWLCGVTTLLIAVGMPAFVSTASMSGAELVSFNKDGTDSGDAFSNDSAISADGRFVAFYSVADDLVAMDTNGKGNLFRRDLQNGTTTLVSINKDGTESGNGHSFDPVISADGRFVGFISYADDLVAVDTNGEMDVFVRDLQSGTTTLVSVNKDGTDSGHSYPNSDPSKLAFSGDGRFVAFSSEANDLVAMDNNGERDVFVRDLQHGTTTLVSVNKDGTESGNDDSGSPVISADGRFVAFESGADNLVTAETIHWTDIFVRDLQRGTTTLVSVGKDVTGKSYGISHNPAISADGRFVAFQSDADDLVAVDTNGEMDVFVRDLQRGTTTLVSINKDGTDSGRSYSTDPAISADGRFVVFQGDADDLVARDSNGTDDVFVRDLRNGSTNLVSVNQDGTDSGNADSFDHVISADGRFIAFFSSSDDLVAADSNGEWDVFVRDLQRGTTALVSVNQDGTDSATGYSLFPAISADGRVVAFSSYADDLVAIDNDGECDIFAFEVYERPQGCDCTDPGAIKGTSGSDFLYGTEQSDIICGLGEQDFIAGQGGDDCIDGGSGNDWIYGGPNADTIFGKAGKDVIYGHRGNDVISGGEDEDFLFGGGDDDWLDGGEGYDWVFCGSGTDEGIGEYLNGCEN